MTQAKRKVLAFILISIFFVIKGNANPLYICFTNSSVVADVTLKFIDHPSLADLTIGITKIGTLADYNICFVSQPTSKSIDVSITNSSAIADHTLCITTSPIADKSLCITNSLTLSDVSICFSDLSTPFTTDICIIGKDVNSITLEQKVALVYRLVMKK